MALYQAPGDNTAYYYAISLDELKQIIKADRKEALKYSLRPWVKTLKSQFFKNFVTFSSLVWLAATIGMVILGHYKDTRAEALLQSVELLLAALTLCVVVMLGYYIHKNAGVRGTSARLATFRAENPELARGFDSGQMIKLSTAASIRGLGREHKEAGRTETALKELLQFEDCDEQLKDDVDKYILDTTGLSVYSLELEEKAERVVRDNYIALLSHHYVKRGTNSLRRQANAERTQRENETRKSK